MRRRSRGLTLLELLIAGVIVGFLTAALVRAYAAGATYPERLRQGRDVELSAGSFDEKLSSLIRRATLSPDVNETASFFEGSAGGASGGGTNVGNADTITFTAAGIKPSAAVLTSQDDFETSNQTYGPQGGVQEISISTTPVGQGSASSGLFERKQIPADGDPTQGGNESVMNPNVTSISFEFWDGTQWLTAWDTATMATKRLPAAVRVTYQIQNDDNPHILVVQLPMSDVTTDNPVTQAAG